MLILTYCCNKDDFIAVNAIKFRIHDNIAFSNKYIQFWSITSCTVSFHGENISNIFELLYFYHSKISNFNNEYDKI